MEEIFNENKLCGSIQPLVRFKLLFFEKKRAVFAGFRKGVSDSNYSRGLELIHRPTKILPLKYQVLSIKLFLVEYFFDKAFQT